MRTSAPIPLRIAVLLLILPLGGAQSSCGTVKKTRKAIKTALEVQDRIERLAEGDESQIVPLVATILNAGQDYVLVHQEDHALVAEVDRIPGLGLKIPRSEGKRYYLRFDLQSLGGATKMALSFFRSDKGVFTKKEDADDIVSKGVSELFSAVLGALLKSGIVFK